MSMYRILYLNIYIKRESIADRVACTIRHSGFMQPEAILLFTIPPYDMLLVHKVYVFNINSTTLLRACLVFAARRQWSDSGNPIPSTMNIVFFINKYHLLFFMWNNVSYDNVFMYRINFQMEFFLFLLYSATEDEKSSLIGSE